MENVNRHLGHKRPHHHKPNHHPHLRHHGFGMEYVDIEFVKNALSKVFPNVNDLEWLLREAINDGPPHRQMRNALILNQMAGLIDRLPVKPTSEIIPLEGTSPREYGFLYPVGLPTKITEGFSQTETDEILDWVGEGPYHDVAMDLLLMHVLVVLQGVIQMPNVNHKAINYEK
jgi:hypothetical protein